MCLLTYRRSRYLLLHRAIHLGSHFHSINLIPCAIYRAKLPHSHIHAAKPNHLRRSPPGTPAISHLTQLIRCLLDVENRPLFLPPHPIILQHPTINARILALKLQHRLRCNSINHEVVVAVWAVLIALFEFSGVLAKRFFALFAGECLGRKLMGGVSRGM